MRFGVYQEPLPATIYYVCILDLPKGPIAIGFLYKGNKSLLILLMSVGMRLQRDSRWMDSSCALGGTDGATNFTKPYRLASGLLPCLRFTAFLLSILEAKLHAHNVSRNRESKFHDFGLEFHLRPRLYFAEFKSAVGLTDRELLTQTGLCSLLPVRLANL